MELEAMTGGWFGMDQDSMGEEGGRGATAVAAVVTSW